MPNVIPDSAQVISLLQRYEKKDKAQAALQVDQPTQPQDIAQVNPPQIKATEQSTPKEVEMTAPPWQFNPPPSPHKNKHYIYNNNESNTNSDSNDSNNKYNTNMSFAADSSPPVRYQTLAPHHYVTGYTQNNEEEEGEEAYPSLKSKHIVIV